MVLLAILLPLSSKLSVLPVSAAVLVPVAWTGLRAFPQKIWLLYAVLLLALATLAFYLLFRQTAEFAWSEINWRLTYMRDDALTWKYIKTIPSQILSTFWGRVGWLAVSLPEWLIPTLTTAGLIGMALQARRLVKSSSGALQKSLWLAAWLVCSRSRRISSRVTVATPIFSTVPRSQWATRVADFYDLYTKRYFPNGTASAVGPPERETITFSDTFEDEFLSDECGVDVTTSISGWITLLTFPDQPIGPQDLSSVHFDFVATAGDNSVRFKDVGIDLVRVEPDGRVVLMIVGQVPFDFTGVLVIDLVQANTKTIVWRGTATGEVNTKANPEKRDRNINS